LNILIVDDEPVSRIKMKKIMSRYGDCDEAATGMSALYLVDNRQYDLMTLDVDMPQMSGIEVLAGVREMEQRHRANDRPPMKIVMVTAMGDRQTFSRSLFTGCDDYIIKPFQPETIDRQMRIMGILPKLMFDLT